MKGNIPMHTKVSDTLEQCKVQGWVPAALTTAGGASGQHLPPQLNEWLGLHQHPLRDPHGMLAASP